MFLKGFAANKSGFGQFLLLLGTILICLSVSLFASQLILQVLGFDVIDNPSFFTDISEGNLGAIKFMQIIYSIAAFLFPPLVFAYMASDFPTRYLGLNKKPIILQALIVTFLFLAIMPLINIIGTWNEALNIPDFIGGSFTLTIGDQEVYFKGLEQWMKDSEAQLAELTETFLNMPNLGDLLLNLIMLAVIPAVGEELLFRGAIQKIIANKSGRIHLAVWVSAILFSAIHMQFYGFFPRMILGAVLGYLFAWTGNIWYPILGHFVNNGTAVLLAFFIQKEWINESVEELGATGNTIVLGISSLILTTVLLYSFRRQLKTVQ